MNPPFGFEINLDDSFPSLKAAPIIEAIIYWQAPSTIKLSNELLEAELTQQLQDYPIRHPIRQLQQDIKIQIDSSDTIDENVDFSQKTRWNGFRLQDQSKCYVAQFTPTRVVFSRLPPYEKWDRFRSEGIKLWKIFVEITKPLEIQRLGVRYINQILVQEGEELSTYLKAIPPLLPGVELTAKAFFHQNHYEVPGYPYTISWVQTVQPNSPVSTVGRAIIIDIEVYADKLVVLDENNVIRHLNEMRWLKNQVFFNSITAKALEKFQG